MHKEYDIKVSWLIYYVFDLPYVYIMYINYEGTKWTHLANHANFLFTQIVIFLLHHNPK